MHDSCEKTTKINMRCTMLRNRFSIAMAIILLNIRFSNGEGCENVGEIPYLLPISCDVEDKASRFEACFCSTDDGIQCERKTLKLKVNNINVNILPPHFFDHVVSLEYIDLSRNNINELSEGVFAKNDQLKWIIISDANLETLSDEQFANISQLEELDLSGNRLLELPANLLSGSINLKKLDFSNNLLQKLSERTFQTQHNLETLYFGSNKLTSIPMDLFVDTPNLIELDLSSNQLSDIPDGTFRKQTSLVELYLGGNGLQQLPQTIFCNLQNLQTLGLDKNELTSLSELQFFNLTELRDLYLFGNKLKTLPERIFLHQYKMKELYLYNNNLTTLQEDLFINATELLGIHLKNNQLQNIPELIFRNQQKLQTIDLSHNQLRFLSNQTFANTNLTYFDVNYNKMQTIPDGIFENLKHVKSIKIDHNELTSLSGDLFANMMDLEYINLKHNQLMKIPEGILKNNNKLDIVRFENNSLSSLPVNLFYNATKLFSIDFSFNKLTDIPEKNFNSQEKLSALHLKGNRFISIPVNLFKNAYNLEFLSISDNFLETIPDKLFQNQRQLRKLVLAKNTLTNLSSSLFVNTPALNGIYLGSNRLLELPQGIFDNTGQLEILDLSGNCLKAFPLDLFKFTPKLYILYLQKNEFKSIDSLQFINLHFVPFWGPEIDTELILSSNRIENVNLNTISDLSRRFKLINLSNNSVATLDYKSENIERSSSHKKLLLNQNPLNCDCQLLKNIRMFSAQIGFDENEMKCNNIEMNPFVNQLRIDDLFCPINFKNYESKHCDFLIRVNDHTLKMNCSGSGLKDVQYLPNITTEMMKEHGALKCELDIQNNDLEQLPNLKLTQFECVQAINARNNSITSIQTENLSNNLTKLDISHNKLTTLSAEVIERLQNLKNLRLVLEANKWECGCDFHKFVLKNAERAGYSNIVCSDGELLQDKSSLCLWGILLVSTLIIFAFSISVSSTLYYKNQTEIKVWLYAHGYLPALTNDNSYDESKKYDAFISYSHRDEKFVFDELLPELVNGPIKFKLCVDVQDWIIGESISDQILSSVEQSRRTIVVLTKNFLQSNWGKMEIRTAHHRALKEGRIRLIVVIYGDIGNIDELDEDLRNYLHNNIYLKWGDRQFFDKLRYSLPHPPQREPNTDDGVKYEMTTF